MGTPIAKIPRHDRTTGRYKKGDVVPAIHRDRKGEQVIVRTKRVEFILEKPEASAVSVAGTFNN
jgi:bifunctional DNA-binding transcriptional regulator/antitoxin component of YhaV-PrlF toxin-antitoxin module